MPTLPSLVAPQVVITTTCGATRDEKAVIITTLVFEYISLIIIAIKANPTNNEETNGLLTYTTSLEDSSFDDLQYSKYDTTVSIKWALQWRHNGCDGVSTHQLHDCLLNRLLRRRSKKTSKLRVTGLCHRWPVNSPHKWPVTRKMFPFDDVISPSPTNNKETNGLLTYLTLSKMLCLMSLFSVHMTR